MAKNWKIASLLILAGALVSTLAVGLYFKHYFVVFMFCLWMNVEYLLWRQSTGWKGLRRVPRTRYQGLAALVGIYGRYDTVSETVVEQKIAELKREGNLSETESRWLWRLRDLLELKGLIFGKESLGRKALKQGFAFGLEKRPPTASAETVPPGEAPSRQDIIEAATVVADLYWKLYDTAVGEYPDLSREAKAIYRRIFQADFDPASSRFTIEKLTDAIQRDEGISFLILNLLRTGRGKYARKIAQSLLQNESEVDSDVLSPLYWISEISWFSKEKESPITDFETTIRYLYHLCFTNPERGGFLEIDSQFFSQFAVVNEIAREGFLFKETLVDRLLELWRAEDHYFDSVFRNVLEQMTQSKSKIYDDRDSWELFWKREQNSFCRDYLYVVEGNLFYAEGSYREALTCYEKAIKENPSNRAARFNVLFCYVKLEMKERHQLTALSLTRDSALLPSAYYIVGNSFLLAGDVREAEYYYEGLRGVQGWERKVDYYKSTFCYENGLYDLALKFAKSAKERNPTDSSVSFHLSLCYNAVGNKDQALNMVREVEEAPGWLTYYRFTLERDSGRDQDASQTLLSIPPDYFDDPEELAAAVDFAKRRQDLQLLRHLKKKA